MLHLRFAGTFPQELREHLLAVADLCNRRLVSPRCVEASIFNEPAGDAHGLYYPPSDPSQNGRIEVFCGGIGIRHAASVLVEEWQHHVRECAGLPQPDDDEPHHRDAEAFLYRHGVCHGTHREASAD